MEKRLDRTEIAWLAGIIEGEGCLRLHNGAALLRVVMTDKDIIERIANLCNRPYYTYKPRKGPSGKPCKRAYVVQIYGEQALYLMESISPYMGIRRLAKINEIAVAREKVDKAKTEQRNKIRDRNKLIKSIYKTGKYSQRRLATRFKISLTTIWSVINDYHPK